MRGNRKGALRIPLFFKKDIQIDSSSLYFFKKLSI